MLPPPHPKAELNMLQGTLIHSPSQAAASPLLGEWYFTGNISYNLGGPLAEYSPKCQGWESRAYPFFLPHHDCLFLWTAKMGLNHCKLWRAWATLSHSLGKHFITRLYFLQIDTIHYTQGRAQTSPFKPWWEEQCWKLGSRTQISPI